MGEYFVHVRLLVGRQAVLHIVNVYLPPNLPNYTSAWLEVMALLDRLPASDPLLLLGDFNAQIALPLGATGPLRGCAAPALSTASCPCGKLILASIQDCQLEILNGCLLQQAHTFTGPAGHSMVDYIIAN